MSNKIFSGYKRLVAREDFIIHSRRESSRSYIGNEISQIRVGCVTKRWNK
jgi:hypothetical protein